MKLHVYIYIYIYILTGEFDRSFWDGWKNGFLKIIIQILFFLFLHQVCSWCLVNLVHVKLDLKEETTTVLVMSTLFVLAQYVSVITHS